MPVNKAEFGAIVFIYYPCREIDNILTGCQKGEEDAKENQEV